MSRGLVGCLRRVKYVKVSLKVLVPRREGNVLFALHLDSRDQK